MADVTYDRDLTALLVVDPYNDFISEGKIWDLIRAVAEANDCVPHMLQVLNAARQAKLRVFYVPHRRYRPGDYETWKYMAPIQKAGWKRRSFEYGTWGGSSARSSSPCQRDYRRRALVFQRFRQLDLQLKKHGIHQLIVIGLIAHTCIEATVRFAPELGYEVTVVKDATADYSDKQVWTPSTIQHFEEPGSCASMISKSCSRRLRLSHGCALLTASASPF